MFDNQYTGRRVFITGHTGFKGFWLTTWLLRLGARVCGYSVDIPTEPSGFATLGLQKHISHTIGDVRDRDSLRRAMKKFQPHIVFHMAAQPIVQKSFNLPVETFEVNAMGTLNVLEMARDMDGLEALVVITSDKCYRNNEWVWGYRETDHLGGKDPYSASKACAELIAQAYFLSFDRDMPRSATVRAGNVIGGGDWAADRVIPDCARALAAHSRVTLRAPSSTRPWQHVLEPLSGYLCLGSHLLREHRGQSVTPAALLHGESFNFGPASETNATVFELVSMLQEHWKDLLVDVPDHPEQEKKEHSLLKLCCDKALACLGWKPVLSLGETIRLTAEWYRDFYHAAPKVRTAQMLDLTMSQIDGYMRTAATRGALWA